MSKPNIFELVKPVKAAFENPAAASPNNGAFNACAILTKVANESVSDVLAETNRGVSSVLLKASGKVLAAVPLPYVDELCSTIQQSPMFAGSEEFQEFEKRVRAAADQVRAQFSAPHAPSAARPAPAQA